MVANLRVVVQRQRHERAVGRGVGPCVSLGADQCVARQPLGCKHVVVAIVVRVERNGTREGLRPHEPLNVHVLVQT